MRKLFVSETNRSVGGFACAMASLWAILRLISRDIGSIPFVLYIAVGGAMIYLFSRKDEHKYRISSVLAVVFTVFTVAGNDGLFVFSKRFMWREYADVVVLLAGLFFLFRKVLNGFYAYGQWKSGGVRKGCRKGTWAVFMISLAVMWAVYFLFFLNQYPGSLSCDTPDQLAQAMGTRAFENANPLIHTLFLTACIRIGLNLFGTINEAVALYTVVQFTMVAMAFAYLVSTIYKKGYHWVLVVLSQLMFTVLPHHIIYAAGMWKDTFFAMLFVAELTYLWNLLEKEKNNIWEYMVLFVLTVVCSLARNSGWSSLLAGAVVLLLVHGRSVYVRNVGISLGAGVVCALVTMLVVYPLCGVTNQGGIVSALSVPLQQVGRVVVNNGEISPEDKALLNEFIPLDRIAGVYEKKSADHMKAMVKKDAMDSRLIEFLTLWVRLGWKNPQCYYEAYVDLMENYWSFEASAWTWDARIFDNKFGVSRDSKYLPDVDLVSKMSKGILSVPKVVLLQRSSTVLWVMLICAGMAIAKKNRIAFALLVPSIVLYAGLMFVAPIALFRYTYAVSACLPLIVCLPWMKPGSTLAAAKSV